MLYTFEQARTNKAKFFTMLNAIDQVATGKHIVDLIASTETSGPALWDYTNAIAEDNGVLIDFSTQLADETWVSMRDHLLHVCVKSYVNELVKDAKANLEDEAERAFFKSHPELNP